MQTNVDLFYEINERILQIVDYERLTQNAFAKKIGISSSRMSNIATKRNKPDSEMLQLILKTFTYVSADWLLTGVGKMNKLEKKTNEVLSFLNEPENTYGTKCFKCVEKDKKIIELQEKLILCQSESLKMYKNKKK